jgi:hypothetical protein
MLTATLTLTKVSDFPVGSHVIDFAWDENGETGTILDTPKDYDPRWEIVWADGLRTFENFETMITYTRVPHV